MSINTILENMISISIAFSSFPNIHAVQHTYTHTQKKEKPRIFSSKVHAHPHKQTGNKRETSILQLSCYNTQGTMRKKNNKCYRGEKENECV